MVLGSHQLKIGGISCLSGIVAHVDHDLFLGCHCHTQGLPCIQAAKSPACILGTDGIMYGDRSPQTGILQDGFRRGQFLFQKLPVRMVFPADRIHGIHLHPQGIYMGLGHICPKRGMQVICIEGHDLVHQGIIMVEIHL